MVPMNWVNLNKFNLVSNKKWDKNHKTRLCSYHDLEQTDARTSLFQLLLYWSSLWASDKFGFYFWCVNRVTPTGILWWGILFSHGLHYQNLMLDTLIPDLTGPLCLKKKSESSLVYIKWNDKEHSLHYWREAVQSLDFGISKFKFFFGFVEPWTIASIFDHSTYCTEIYYWMKFLFKASGAESALKFWSALGTLAHHEEP